MVIRIIMIILIMLRLIMVLLIILSKIIIIARDPTDAIDKVRRKYV